MNKITMRVLVTGSGGFIGRNLCAVLRARDAVEIFEFDIPHSSDDLAQALSKVDFIIHLAGVNRPKDPAEFETGNAGSIDEICQQLDALDRRPKIILSSSVQAEQENPYGLSKRHAEERLEKYVADTGAVGVVYRLKNLFGKWCRPNYNSVTATFCHNIANDLSITISDPNQRIALIHIDEVVSAFVAELKKTQTGFSYADPLPATEITLGQLAETLRGYKLMRENLLLPNFTCRFERALYGTYLSYLGEYNFDYTLEKKSDPRGSLAEFVKSSAIGQIFVSRTKPGITRGDHYHHTKTEKFLVLNGEAVIRFRRIDSDEVIEYPVRGEEFRVLDIPPGYTHSIENVGQEELVTLFWVCEPFDPERPDTCFEPVHKDPST